MKMDNDWWASLNHGGLLIAPGKISECFLELPEALPDWQVERMRRALTAFDGSSESLAVLLDFLLQDLSGLPSQEWQKAQQVESRWAIRSFTGEQIKPRRIWQGPNDETLPVFVPEAGATRQFSGRLGVGRSRQLLGRVVEWLRRLQQPLALVTNGRQWRLVHAGQDYDAWCEWDIDLWFEEGQPGSQTTAWRQLLNREVLLAPKAEEKSPLINAILDSRKGQAELSAVLGERVRQAVEELITASHGTIEQAQQTGNTLDYRDLYLAGTRIIMRCIIALFAEARGLLPVDNPIYQHAYSLEGLRQQLDRRAGGRGSERLALGRSAWPRLIALFNLVYHGSAHSALPIPQYTGGLFAPGASDSDDGISRALALLEGTNNAISDRQVLQILRLLTRTRVRVRQGRRSTWVDGPVDFSALSSEYIGILYEGLLDYELKQTDARDPVIFLGIGRQPALPLSRLETMDDKALKQLFEALKKKEKSSAEEGSEEDEEAPDEITEINEDDTGKADADDSSEAGDGGENVDTSDESEITLSEGDLARAQRWLEHAAEIAGLVKKPRGKKATDSAEYQQARARAARQLCARLIAPGQFYLVRWGGTRKGAGTFYTRPQLAAPTVRRTLQPLAFTPVRTEVNPRTGLEDVVEWEPKTPEVILSLKICDPAMGSGSFLAGALRYLTDALVQSLYYHQRIERRQDGAVARLADGRATQGLGEQLLPLPPEHEGFEDTLRAQLKRHLVERCLYGVDLDPLAVELGRMALWVETMDRSLPFGFLDHKLKIGNALVGAWFDNFREYPAMAWEREGGDKDYQKNKPNNLINHYFVDDKGKKRGDVYTAAIKARKPQVQQELIDALHGQLLLDKDHGAADVHDELLAVFEQLHHLPVHETEARARLYREQVLENPHYHDLKARMDLWCALWYWPGGKIAKAPLPTEFEKPSEEALEIAKQVASNQKFFHWELEFPDVFTPNHTGFDAVLGNPPWETMQPISKEFFSNIDPLYRAYGKQEALGKQLEYFREWPEIEHNWLSYVAHFKAIANWLNNGGMPFGDRITVDSKGKKKHDLNLGGRGKNSFDTSEQLHAKWRKRRQQRISFSDRDHPFQHQGSGKPYLQKMFLELSHALLRDKGRLGMIVPSGIYTDKGTTELREMFLGCCEWQWLFGLENREGIFDIHRSFKFCPIVIEKGGNTRAIRAAFMHRNVDDWEVAERYVLAYPRERVEEFSPYSKAILEIRTEQDLRMLQKIYSNSVLLGDKSERGWGIKYQQGDFNMTSDSKLFPPRPKWVEKGYQPDEYGHWLKGAWRDYEGPVHILDREHELVLSRDGSKAIPIDAIEDVALPLFQGGMVNIYDNNAAGFVETSSAQATWMSMSFGGKEILPQYLVSLGDCLKKGERFKSGLKLAFRDIARNTDTRSAIGALIDGFPCGNTLGVFSATSRLIAPVAFAFSSIAFDWLVRRRLGGTHINLFVAEECAVSRKFADGLNSFIGPLLRLTFTDLASAKVWKEFEREVSRKNSWRRLWAITDHERCRVKAILEAVAFHMYGLDLDDVKQVLRGLDIPPKELKNELFCKSLDARGFWRIDKEKEPELRHTVLSLVAFYDLDDKGLDVFLSQNDGEGWLIPDTLRLADYGLGHNDRAQEGQPVASRLGPRFYDWQLDEDVDRSWEECEAHAELIRRIVPPPVTTDETESVEELLASYSLDNAQGDLF